MRETGDVFTKRAIKLWRLVSGHASLMITNNSTLS
jgi:hypothetical protein